ncbi:hypothetical protein BDA96_02G158200 [Sorghum bicolor]|uniref:Reverse transcriptase zinc-binding domain-containing protein n=2 Tax=Sorghum bicolor TaxID=4558 RepID=A0A921RPU7_SORBI|nr:hypothetical protein BDA96_02G158200 [Sorghum bicolor]KXG35279.1 hypothetical protein SORBI_3002G151900 [Sorghum bicolor]
MPGAYPGAAHVCALCHQETETMDYGSPALSRMCPYARSLVKAGNSERLEGGAYDSPFLLVFWLVWKELNRRVLDKFATMPALVAAIH